MKLLLQACWCAALAVVWFAGSQVYGENYGLGEQECFIDPVTGRLVCPPGQVSYVSTNYGLAPQATRSLSVSRSYGLTEAVYRAPTYRAATAITGIQVAQQAAEVYYEPVDLVQEVTVIRGKVFAVPRRAAAPVVTKTLQIESSHNEHMGGNSGWYPGKRIQERRSARREARAVRAGTRWVAGTEMSGG